MTIQEDTTRFNQVLGAIAFVFFLFMVGIDALPEYDVSPYLAALLVITYLFLLGFGVAVTRILEAKYE